MISSGTHVFYIMNYEYPAFHKKHENETRIRKSKTPRRRNKHGIRLDISRGRDGHGTNKRHKEPSTRRNATENATKRPKESTRATECSSNGHMA
ncbi:MAG: hypothetical protein [Microviridae sp.]|nr:MAG: hypothetical protein [Microviridae sp.]